MTTPVEDPVWEPVDEAEMALKAAFTGLNEAATKAIVQGLIDTPNKFILHTRGYYGASLFLSFSFSLSLSLSLSLESAIVCAVACDGTCHANHARRHENRELDLRAYVLTGKDFPKTVAEFQTKMPKSAFTKLTLVDPEIYNASSSFPPFPRIVHRFPVLSTFFPFLFSPGAEPCFFNTKSRH